MGCMLCHIKASTVSTVSTLVEGVWTVEPSHSVQVCRLRTVISRAQRVEQYGEGFKVGKSRSQAPWRSLPGRTSKYLTRADCACRSLKACPCSKRQPFMRIPPEQNAQDAHREGQHVQIPVPGGAAAGSVSCLLVHAATPASRECEILTA